MYIATAEFSHMSFDSRQCTALKAHPTCDECATDVRKLAHVVDSIVKFVS